MTAETESSENRHDDTTSDSYTCAYCGQRFASEEWLALHRGIEHEGELSPREHEAYETAYEAEQEELRLFRLKALVVLVLVYFSFLIVYAFVT